MNTAEHGGLRQGRNLEDRECARFVVLGATISRKKSDFRHLRNDFASEERLPVVDISKLGISFLTDNLLTSSSVSLLLQYSDHENLICLKGRVAYSLPCGMGHSYRYQVGVRFDPFSTKKDDNPVKALRILEKLKPGQDIEST
jgi:hypothetical protein